MRIRKWIAWLTVAAGLLILPGACAEQKTPDLGLYDPFEREPATVAWQEMNVPRGTKLPVYSAPYEDAWRGAGGKAAVDTDESFSLLPREARRSLGKNAATSTTASRPAR